MQIIRKIKVKYGLQSTILLIVYLLFASPVLAVDWEMNISAYTSTKAENRISLGQKTGATDGFDGRYDTPSYTEGDMSTYFPHPEWGEAMDKFWRDIKAPGREKSWLFKVATPISGQVTLIWSSTQIPFGYTALLVDLGGGGTIDMTTSSVYSYANNGERSFSVQTVEPLVVEEEPEDDIIVLSGDFSSDDDAFGDDYFDAEEDEAANDSSYADTMVVFASGRGEILGLGEVESNHNQGEVSDIDTEGEDPLDEFDLYSEENIEGDKLELSESPKDDYDDFDERYEPAIIIEIYKDESDGCRCYVVKWERDLSGEWSYLVERKDSEDSQWFEIATLDMAVNEYTDTEVEFDKDLQYFYRVMKKPVYDEDRIRLKGLLAGKNSIFLRWSEGVAQLGYYVERQDGDDGDWKVVALVGEKTRIYTDKDTLDFSKFRTYHYRIRAFNGDDDFKYSTVESICLEENCVGVEAEIELK